MGYDCLIIGGGLAGLTCGITCLSEGLRTVIISSGTNALHFSSGSIDVFGYTRGREPINRPFDYIDMYIKEHPGHPYARLGAAGVREAIEFFISQVAKEDLPLVTNGEGNHFHVTGIGTLKPTYLSQPSVFNERIRKAWEDREPIAILNFVGYRDYYAEMAAEQLKKHPLFHGVDIFVDSINLPYYAPTERNLLEFRSTDLARVFDTEKYLPRIAGDITKKSGKARIVCLPAFIGIRNCVAIHRKLEEMTGKLIYEVPSLPPSILGMRLDNALLSRFASLGGEFSIGDTVTGGEIIGGTLDHVHTRNYGTTRHHSKYYVLATGSFFSNGLKSEFNRITEPVMDLAVSAPQKRNEWYSEHFFDQSSHPFLGYGVETTERFNPIDASGSPVGNIFCAGSILCGYDPIREASGGGVAIATGYRAAREIIGLCKGARP